MLIVYPTKEMRVTRAMALVEIFAGSKSDIPIIEESGMLGILAQTVGLDGFRLHIASAHRNPDELQEWSSGMFDDDPSVFIGVAGMAAALPGAIAGETHGECFVIGVPLDEHGIESCLYMPPGRPVAVPGVGKTGLKNAAIMAAQVLAMHDPLVEKALAEFQDAAGAAKPAIFDYGIAPEPIHRGKVRDTYRAGKDQLLVVASDRVSAFDVVFDEEVPGKGTVLTSMTRFWFELFPDVKNHYIASGSLGLARLPNAHLRAAAGTDGRWMLVEKLEMLPLEFIVRGYLFGSVVKEYEKSGTACGIKLEPGLKSGSRLLEPILTPSTKADAGLHDENVTPDQARQILTYHGFSSTLYDMAAAFALDLYDRAAAYAEERGIVIADTKFEFGVNADGKLVLGDEVLTPDSSRFWDLAALGAGTVVQYDKQGVRDYCRKEHPEWDKTSPAPALPPAVIADTQERYSRALEMLTGPKLVDA